MMFELHRLGHNDTMDRDLLKEYFEAVVDFSITVNHMVVI